MEEIIELQGVEKTLLAALKVKRDEYYHKRPIIKDELAKESYYDRFQRRYGISNLFHFIPPLNNLFRIVKCEFISNEKSSGQKIN